MTAKEVLEKAKANLASEDNVVLDFEDYYEKADGSPVDTYEAEEHRDICRFCLLGALYVLCENPLYGMCMEYENAIDLLRHAAAENGFDVSADATPANHSRMLAIYDRAISLAGRCS